MVPETLAGTYWCIEEIRFLFYQLQFCLEQILVALLSGADFSICLYFCVDTGLGSYMSSTHHSLPLTQKDNGLSLTILHLSSPNSSHKEMCEGQSLPHPPLPHSTFCSRITTKWYASSLTLSQRKGIPFVYLLLFLLTQYILGTLPCKYMQFLYRQLPIYW